MSGLSASRSPTQADPDSGGSEALALDTEDLRALKIFHRSFNLPGIRLGLVAPVSRDEYFPPEEREQTPAPVAVKANGAGSESVVETTVSLLARANQLLGGAEEVSPGVGQMHGA